MRRFVIHNMIGVVLVCLFFFMQGLSAMNQKPSLALVPYDEKNKALVPYHQNVLLKRLLKKRLNNVLGKRKSKNLSEALNLETELLKRWRILEEKISPACMLFKEGDFFEELHSENSVLGVLYQLFSFYNDFAQLGLYSPREVKVEVCKFLKGKKRINFDVLLPLAEKFQLPDFILHAVLRYLLYYPHINEQGEKELPSSPREKKKYDVEDEFINLDERPGEYVLWNTAVGHLEYGRYLKGRIESEMKLRSPHKNKMNDEKFEQDSIPSSLFAQPYSFEFLSKYLCLCGGYKKNFYTRMRFEERVKKLFETMRPKLNIADFLNLANAVIAPKEIYYPFFNYLSELLVLNKSVLGYSREVDNAWRLLTESGWGDFLSKRFLGMKMKLFYWDLCRACLRYEKPFGQLLWLPGNRCLIAAEKKLFLWDLNKMKVYAGDPLVGPIKSMGVDSSGGIVLLSALGGIQRFELANEKLTWTLGVHLGAKDYVTQFSQSWAGKIVWKTLHNLVGVWNLANNNNELFYNDHLEHHTQLMPDGKTLLASDKNSIRSIDMSTYVETLVFPDKNELKMPYEKGCFRELLLSEKANILMGRMDDDSVLLWKLCDGHFYLERNFRIRARKSNTIAKIKAMALSPNERMYAVADEEGAVGIFSLGKEGLIEVFQTDFGAGIDRIQFDKESALLFVQGLKHKIRVWDIISGQSVNEWTTPLGTLIRFFSVSPFEERLLVSSGGLKNIMHFLGGSAELEPLSYLVFKSIMAGKGFLKPLYSSEWLPLEVVKCKETLCKLIKPASLKIVDEKLLGEIGRLKEKQALKQMEIFNEEIKLDEVSTEDKEKIHKKIKEAEEEQESSLALASKKRKELKKVDQIASINPLVLSYESTLCS